LRTFEQKIATAPAIIWRWSCSIYGRKTRRAPKANLKSCGTSFAAAPPAPLPAAAPPATSATPAAPVGKPILGAGALIVANMERSLGVPTATSFRDVPAKLLEVNRKIVNGFLGRSGAGKISFTHLIAYAIVRTIADDMPVMSATFAEDAEGKPRVVHHDHVNVGIAVDMEKSDGTRTLVVPVIKQADTLDFAGFRNAYEDLVRRAKTGKLQVTDFQGATITITNPGTIGTVQSVPRLMPGQGVIVGVGTIDYPAEWQGADERALSELAVSKVVTLTSTYDHRIIQGAESGMFLKAVHERLMGEHEYYHDVFRSLGVPYEEVKWRRDVSPLDREEALLHKQMQVATLIRAYRARGHRIADLDPLDWKEPAMPDELDPATYGLTIWDLDREFLTGGVAGKDRMHLGDLLGVLRDAYCRSIGIEYMHIQDTDEQRWIQSKVEGIKVQLSSDELRHLLERLNAAEALERFLATKYVGTKRFGLEGAEFQQLPLGFARL
jgi:2-oxoglutarate dehydrogenase E1 component